MPQTVALSEIKYDPSIYPREKWNTHTIGEYVDAMKAGSQFPPLILEDGTNRLLDGVHRWKAYLQYLEAWNEHQAQPALDGEFANGWAPAMSEVPVEWHTVPNDVPTKLYAAGLSAKHGDRLSSADARNLAREIFTDNPDFTLEVLCEHLPISKSRAGEHVADIRARRKEQQRMTAYRLHRLGWTQEEQALAIGMKSQGAYQTNFLSRFPTLENEIKNLLSSGIPHLDVAERYNMPLILVWAIDLQGRTDEQRFERLGINSQPYDTWHFAKCHDLFGSPHPGRIPGELVAHVLYFFTEPGAKVIDPMGGSGTTLDVCLAMGRECYAYDIDDRHQRPDIIKHDISKDGWPERIKKADLIFWDPPYFSKMDSSTIGSDGYIDGSISKLSRQEYLEFFNVRLAQLHRMVRKGTKIAFLMSDWDDDTEKQQGIFIWTYANQLQGAGWNMKRHIQVPLSTQQVHPDIVNKFRKSRRLARLERYLLIAEA